MWAVSKDNLAKTFSEKCTEKCSQACKCIMDLMEKSRTGSLTIVELRNLTTHILQVVKLFSVVPNKTSTSLDFSQVIAQRNRELEKFHLHHHAIKVLLEQCEDILEGIYVVF